MADLPHVRYVRRKAGGGGAASASDGAFRLQEEANRRARERRMRDGGLTVGELFAGKGQQTDRKDGKH